MNNKIFPAKNGIPTDAVMAIRRNNPSEILVGFSSWDKTPMANYVEALPSMAAQVYNLAEESFTHMSFVQTPNVRALAHAGGDGVRTVLESHITNGNTLDAQWEKEKLGWAVHTTAILFHLAGESAYYPSSPLKRNLSVPEETVNELQTALEEVFGKGCVFVSHQVIHAPTMFEKWNEFEQQARSRMVDGEKYWRHEYDTQTHPAKELHIPFYAIPVSILMKWDRTVDIKVHNEMMMRLESLFMSRLEMSNILSGIRNDVSFIPCGHILCSRESFLQDMSDFRGCVYHTLSLSGTPMPETLPEKKRSFLKKFEDKLFGWANRLFGNC